VDGLRVAHLQCNCGQDSLSIARLGAQVVGCDISDAAIDEAVRLSADSGIACDFEREDVITWLERSRGEGYDVVFCSYGCISWLCDLHRWACGIAAILRPSGRLVLVEFHPLAWSLGDNGALSGDPYFDETPAASGGGKGITNPAGVSDYVGQSGGGLIPEGMGAAKGERAFANPEPIVEFTHTTADLVSAIASAGLHVEMMREYPYSNGCQLFGGMRELPGRRYSVCIELVAWIAQQAAHPRTCITETVASHHHDTV
jgi:SAM-dependent methyltransferase